jgi:hypothetical protein
MSAALHAALAVFATDVQLQADVQRRCVEGALRRQPLGDLETVDGVHPGEVLGDRASLVSLQAPDEMPGELAACQRLDLRQGFLHEVLAEMFDPGARGAINCCAALSLRNGQKRDRIDISPRRAGGLGNTVLSSRDALRAILRKG